MQSDEVSTNKHIYVNTIYVGCSVLNSYVGYGRMGHLYVLTLQLDISVNLLLNVRYDPQFSYYNVMSVCLSIIF